MYISYSTINGHLYAQLAEPERGVFTFDPATGIYGTVSPDFTEPPKRKKGKYIHVNGKKRSRLCIEFGNSFFLDEFLKWIVSLNEEKLCADDILEAISFQEQYFMGELYTL